MTYVIDNTVLSNFAVVGEMELLHNILGENAFVTESVKSEFMCKDSFKSLKIPFQILSTSPLDIKNFKDVLRLLEPVRKYRGLHDGEISCIVQTINENAKVVLTDDNLARRYCEKEKLEVHGTVFVLARGVKLNLLSVEKAEEILAVMKKRGYSLTDSITVKTALNFLD